MKPASRTGSPNRKPDASLRRMWALMWPNGQSLPARIRACCDNLRRRVGHHPMLGLGCVIWIGSCAASSPSTHPLAEPQHTLESPASVGDTSSERPGRPVNRDAGSLPPSAEQPDHPRSEARESRPNSRDQGRTTLLQLDELPPPVFWTAPKGPSARPLVVAAHGAGGTPEWHCGWLTQAVGTQAHVLCLRGHAIARGADAYYYPEHHTLEQLFLEGTQAAMAVLPSNAATKDGHVYVGYSQGATMGALMIVAHAERFPNLLLIEGGHSHWTQQRSRDFAARGGHRVYFACGQASCKRAADRSSQRLSAAGIEVRVGYAPGAGHTPAGEVGSLAVEGLQWLLLTP